jgi:hypothetical protein
MSDPVAEKSGFLKMYMSNHPDTLVAYAKWYGKVAEPMASAEMSAIDTKVAFVFLTSRLALLNRTVEHDAHLHPQGWEQEAGTGRAGPTSVGL